MEINEEQLAQILSNTISTDKIIRCQAEKSLRRSESQPHHVDLLLKLMENENVDMTIRIASSIAFKHFVNRNWRPRAVSFHSIIIFSECIFFQ